MSRSPERFALLQSAAQQKPHGTRARYVSGCKCFRCRLSNTNYEHERMLARRRGDTAGIVDAAPARRHLRELSRQGVGRRAVSAASGIPESTLHEIRTGRKKQIRERTLRKILAVDKSAIAGHALVPAGPTWKLLDELIGRGYTRTQLAIWLGSKSKHPALQLKRDFVTAANAAKVREMCRKIEAGLLARP